MRQTCIAFLLTIITISCNKGVDLLPFDIAKMQKQIELNPDSIANILEESINPNTLTDQDKADYWFLLVQTHLRQGRNLINDSLIHFSTEYYKANNSPHLSAAYRLAGYQTNWSETKAEEEKPFLLKALEVAKNTGDTVEIIKDYKALANTYFRGKEYSKTIDTHRKIIKYSSSAKTIYTSTCMIGVAHAMLGARDSCFVFHDKAIELVVKENNDPSSLYHMLRSYADCLNRFGDSKKAIDIMNQANLLTGNINNRYFANFTYSNAWLNLNQLDSAKVYIDYLEKNNLNIEPTNEDYFFVNNMTAMLRSVYNEKKGYRQRYSLS